MPLRFRKLRRAELQPIVLDKAAGKLSPWKGHLLNRTGRLVLISSVVTATATYFLSAFLEGQMDDEKDGQAQKEFSPGS